MSVVSPLAQLRVLHETTYYVVGVELQQQTALLRRTAEPFPDLTVLRAENDRAITSFIRCKAAGIVVDMRAAPPNNEPEFENAMRSLRWAVGKRFARVVVVVGSASGEMQVARLHRTEQSGYGVTRDYGEAWRVAAGGV